MMELKPTNSQKSFYGKAMVSFSENGGKTLYSYGTPIAVINSDGTFEKLWRGYSATTMKHINSFRETFGLSKLSKSQWEKL